MNTLTVIMIVLGSILMILAALFAIIKKDLLVATIATSVISLVLSVFFFMLQAPDVALTEAAIGVALTTIIFVIAIKVTKRNEENN